MRDVETLKPFTRFLMTIGTLPSSYLVSMTYEEQLLWFCNFLQNNVIPVVNNNAEAVIELQNYVSSYFDNLDVQEEINNKLDEMAEAGTLEEIIAEYLNSTAVFGFDTVADMKSATNLINGSFAKTLGYYNINDGGGATYKIRTVTVNDDVDEMFIIAISETLVAELILDNNVIYANQLGIDNTGTNDSSVKINKALQKINEFWLDNIKINTLIFEGIYKLDYQVEIPPCAKLRSNGLVKFISNVYNNSTFFIHYLNNTLPSTDYDKTKYMSGDIINFESGSILISSGNNHNDGAIAIEIGDKSDLGSDYAIARYMIKNLNIYNFNIGILHNSYNVYIGNYENVIMELNETNVKFGLYSQIATFSNAGERMTFNNCIFGPSTYGCSFDSINWTVFFNNCSFDFNTNVFYQSNATNYWNRINASECHFEGFTTLINNFNDNEEFININNSIILNTTGSNTLFVNSNKTKINIIDTQFNNKYDNNMNATDLVYNQRTFQKNTRGVRSATHMQYSLADNLLNTFDSLEDGVVTSTAGSSIGMFKVIEKYGISDVTVVTDNDFYTGHKSLVLTKASTDSSIILESDYIPLKNEELIMSGIITKNMKNRQMRCMIEFYDYNKTSVKFKTSFEWYPTTISDDVYVINPLTNFDTVPANACYYKIRAILPSMGASDPVSTQYKIAGIISNSR